MRQPMREKSTNNEQDRDTVGRKRESEINTVSKEIEFKSAKAQLGKLTNCAHYVRALNCY